jgi:membrane protein YdbS with pleckstrin-like domain
MMWGLEAAVEGLVLLALAVVAGPVTRWLPVPWWAVVLLALAVTAYVVVVPPWRYAVHRWEVTDTAVYTQTGWWARERRIAPMSRIQTVDHAEGALSRLFGLATVTVTTASAAGALEIAGLERGRALALVDELTLMADTIPGDAT